MFLMILKPEHHHVSLLQLEIVQKEELVQNSYGCILHWILFERLENPLQPVLYQYLYKLSPSILYLGK